MATPSRVREQGGARAIIVGVVAAILVLPGLYTWLVLWWAYSEGERAGYVQKFSRKGYVCKTWEGELAMTTVPGTAPTFWQFTVRDEGTVQKIQDTVGKRVALHYTEHVGIPSSCFGDTPYYVDDVRLIEDVP